MSAILLGQKRLDILRDDEEEIQIQENEPKEERIEGKNRTYIITKTLGKGTFGKVKLAHNINNEKEKYACKILLKSNIKDNDDYIRCKREMEILNKMHHVNIVRTYEIISTDTTYYIFMDYCAKGELFNYIVEKQHLSGKMSAFFYYQIINGIDYIHKKGVCHRDLKPENLLLTEKMKIKIIDFGLSNFYSKNLLETPCGSPCYASPEMVMGNKYDGFCIDIWSSGIILYAMLCGYLPFEEMENDEYNEVLFKNIVECNVEYPEEFISPLAKDLLTKIIVKDPNKRITIDEIKEHNFYLLGEVLYKQFYENNANMKEFELLVNSKDSYLEKPDIIRKTDHDKDIIKPNKKNSSNDKNELKNVAEKVDKEVNTNNNSNKKREKENDNQKNKNIEKAISGGDINSNNSSQQKSNQSKKTETKKPIKKTSSKRKEQKNNKSNSGKNSKNILKENVDNKVNKGKNVQNPINIRDREVEKKQSIKQFSSPNYNNIKYISNKPYENSLERLLILKTEQNLRDEKMPKIYSVPKDKNKYDKKYLNTEIYPTNTGNKNKNLYQSRLINKKSFNDNKITFNNIIKSLQFKNYSKSKTPNKLTMKKKITIKKNVISTSNRRNKNTSHNPGIRRYDIYNNNYKIEKNSKFPRKENYPLITHNNEKNYYYFGNNDNMNKNSSHKNFKKKNNKNIKPNEKFTQKDKKKINYPLDKKRTNNTNNNLNIVGKAFSYNRTLGNSKTNLEKEISKTSTNKALNIKSFEYYLPTNNQKPKNEEIKKPNSNNNNNNNFRDNNFNKNANQKFTMSKKALSNFKEGSIYLQTQDNSKPVIINSRHSRINTESNCNNINIAKNTKMKKNNIHNLYNLNYNDNIISKDKDNNIIINFNILKPNIIFDKQKSSKRSKTNRLFLNGNKNNKNNSGMNKIERTLTESNNYLKVKNNFYTGIKNKNNNYNNYKNIDTNQIKKSKEINQIIKSIQEMQKIQGNYNSFNKK